MDHSPYVVLEVHPTCRFSGSRARAATLAPQCGTLMGRPPVEAVLLRNTVRYKHFGKPLAVRNAHVPQIDGYGTPLPLPGRANAHSRFVSTNRRFPFVAGTKYPPPSRSSCGLWNERPLPAVSPQDGHPFAFCVRPYAGDGRRSELERRDKRPSSGLSSSSGTVAVSCFLLRTTRDHAAALQSTLLRMLSLLRV